MNAKFTLFQHFLAADLQKNGDQIKVCDRDERFPLSRRLRKTEFPVHGVSAHIQNAEYYAISNLRDGRFRMIGKDCEGRYRISSFHFQGGAQNIRWELRGSSRGVEDLTQFPKLKLDMWSPSVLKRAI